MTSVQEALTYDHVNVHMTGGLFSISAETMLLRLS